MGRRLRVWRAARLEENYAPAEPARARAAPAVGNQAMARVFGAATRGTAGEIPYRAEMEQAFGTDFSSVRAHMSRPAEMAAIGAHAATSGNEVVFASANPGREVVAHELAHVVQQGAATVSRDAVSSPADRSEREASDVARQVVAGRQVRVSAAPDAGIHRDALDPSAFRAQIAHAMQQQRVYGMINAGLAATPDLSKGITTDVLWHNSCEWIKNGNCEVVVLSPLPDDIADLPDHRGYFDATVKYPAIGGSFPVGVSASMDPRVVYHPASWAGAMTGDTLLSIVDPAARSNAELRAAIIHEVQHDADQASEGERWADPASPALDLYKTEFRGYWIQHGEHDPADAFGSSLAPATNEQIVFLVDQATSLIYQIATNFKNLRQEKIFWHLVGSGGYPYVAQHYAQVEEFRKKVNAFDQPLGGNLVNSVRIQSLSEAIDVCSPHLVAGTPVDAMLAAAGQLDAADRQYLRDATASRDLWDRARTRLWPAVFAMLHNMVWHGHAGPVGDFPEATSETRYA